MKNNISILEKDNCTGCRMCEQICPVNAIKMITNKEGFIEPVIDTVACIDCGLCFKRCPQLNDIETLKQSSIKVYAAKNNDIQVQKQSSSGGIVSGIASYVLENKGSVYGSAFDEEFKVEYIKIEKKEDLYKIRGSKYVQSNTLNTFKQVKEDLQNDRFVLYTGTPCQIAGIKQFLGKDYDNFFTIDLVCHGVPSPKLFSEYIKYLNEKYKSKVTEFKFRSKERHGWGPNLKIVFENGLIKYTPANIDPYFKSFLQGKTQRKCCYNCQFSNINRIGDITVADYWGIDKHHPEFLDENGVSAVLINSEKGLKLWKEVEKTFEYNESSIEKARDKNHNLNLKTEKSDLRDSIYENLGNKNFKKYIKEDLKYRGLLKDKIKSIIPVRIKKIGKKIRKGKKK